MTRRREEPFTLIGLIPLLDVLLLMLCVMLVQARAGQPLPAVGIDPPGLPRDGESGSPAADGLRIVIAADGKRTVNDRPADSDAELRDAAAAFHARHPDRLPDLFVD